MKKKLLIISTILSTFAVSSCNYLDVSPSQITSENDVYGKMSTAEQALARLYNNVIPNSDFVFSRYMTATDMALDHWENPVELVYNNDAWGPTNNPFGDWSSMYVSIRRATIFMNHIEGVPIPKNNSNFYQINVPRFKAEARFLRAFAYFQLIERYGAVPIVKKVIDVNNTSSSNLARNSVDEVVNYIVNECDTAAAHLPKTRSQDQKGRITRGAALALKARTLLFAASPLFNGNTMYAGIKNRDGTQLFPQTYKRKKWKKAADAAKAVLDLGVYHLYNPTPNNPVHTYAKLFYTANYTEDILVRQVNFQRYWSQYYLPNGKSFGGYGRDSPLQELVNAYDMKNGLPVTDPNSGYKKKGFWSGKLWDGKRYVNVNHISNMYKNRDPRFYASIFFNNDVWNYNQTGRPTHFAYYGNNNGDVDGWPKQGTNSNSGYNIRKFSDPQVNVISNKGQNKGHYPVFRLAGIYLDYAEALNEYLSSPNQQVYNAINKVRERVNMPDLPLRPQDKTKKGMRKRIHDERRVELAFEQQRFWDVRRWMIGTKVDNGPVHGLNAQPSQQELQATGYPVDSKKAGEAVFYKVVTIQNRIFTDRDYLMPIPKNEVDRDSKLVQNYGW